MDVNYFLRVVRLIGSIFCSISRRYDAVLVCALCVKLFRAFLDLKIIARHQSV